VEGGQYFSYQFTTAKDRKSAVIEAHGDLDGQGRVVVVESIVTVNQDGAVERTPPSDSSGGEPLLLPVAP
jgi:hypothetical protein